MSKLRKSAKGQQCQIRIYGVCNHDTATTVLCHLPGAGMGRKHNDLFAAFGCSACHDEVDRRTRIVEADFANQCHKDGVFRTQQYWVDNGFIGELK